MNRVLSVDKLYVSWKNFVELQTIFFYFTPTFLITVSIIRPISPLLCLFTHLFLIPCFLSIFLISYSF